MAKRFVTGAKPPPNMGWMIGKTRASIDFVREAENAISWVVSQIKAVKSGEVVLYDEVSVESPLIYGWERALVKPEPIELAIDSFSMNYIDGDNVWGCGERLTDDETVIVACVIDASKTNLPEEFGGFKVVIEELDRPVPLKKE